MMFARFVGVVVTLGIFMVAGCGGSRSAIPQSITIELPDGSTVDVSQGAGVLSLADSTWEFYQSTSAGQSLPFVTIHFGPEGNLDRFDDNTLGAEIFGDSILFDGARHNTTQPGLQYAAATFGAETSDASGFTFEGRLAAFAGGFQVANANATAMAIYDPDDPDTVVGTFTFSSRVTVASIPEGDVDLEFAVTGHRVTD
jgi:hypothetical protein